MANPTESSSPSGLRIALRWITGGLLGLSILALIISGNPGLVGAVLLTGLLFGAMFVNRAV